jgi:hypothetical protein
MTNSSLTYAGGSTGATTDPDATPSAVVWIDGRHALVTETNPDGHISTIAIERGPEAELPYLARAVRAIGDRERVMILGPNAVRTELEREYVTIYHRPERLVDVEPAGTVEERDLVDRLRVLAV